MQSNEVRELFLKYFKDKDHQIIPSSSLIPYGDNSLLFTTAGMVQIKPFFLGLQKPPKNRLASCQKCFRTSDLDDVGDTKHLTFFEMLGNFSVGDYFKKEAILWAWEFVNDVLKLESERLWFTVYKEDNEAYEIWLKLGIPQNKILKFDKEDNFWGPAGDFGPCGPCSEIHYDFGVDIGCKTSSCNPSCKCGRFLEVWNLVFTEYNQTKDGKLEKLSKPNIDTGMGLERLTAVLQKVPTVYETDLFQPIIKKIESISNKRYSKNTNDDIAIRIIAEHSRGISFLLADGVLPSNEGRGYVLRRLIRRASYFGRKLGIERPFLSEAAEAVVDKMGNYYPELVRQRVFIEELIKVEEQKFENTLDIGMSMIEKMINQAKQNNSMMLGGKDVFRLLDTYGFPFELTMEIAKRNGLNVDTDEFNKEMEMQRQRARSSQKFATFGSGIIDITYVSNSFIGYHSLRVSTNVILLYNEALNKLVEKAEEGQRVIIVLKETPFYAEMGGQVGDTGIIKSDTGYIEVTDSYLIGNVYVSVGEVKHGYIEKEQLVEANVDILRRKNISRNHTATHLLHNALRNILGSHVLQRGSFVTEDRLRFDFSHLKELSSDEIEGVEKLVNENIRSNHPVYAFEIPYKEAIESGAIALFEEKYGDVVRMIKIGEPPVSMELCGGTHVRATGEIGEFLILSEGSIGSGLRRIEAATGMFAEMIMRERNKILNDLSKLVRADYKELNGKILSLIEENKNKEKTIEKLKHENYRHYVDQIITNAETVKGRTVIARQLWPMTPEDMRILADMLKQKIGSGVIILASTNNSSVNYLVVVSKDLSDKVSAQKIIQEISIAGNGKGGGSKLLAQAASQDIQLIEKALKSAINFVSSNI